MAACSPKTSVPTQGIDALVTSLCWVIVVFDGHDLIVYGTALPRLLTEPGRSLTVAGAGLLGSLAFAGRLVGAVLAGTLSDPAATVGARGRGTGQSASPRAKSLTS